jgi:teichuronic acid biosynthesis glycosyltransferase TuaH
VLGGQPPERVPALMRALDVGLIPYLDTAFNRNSNPVKFYEYLALGMPVVSTDIPTLRRFERVASVGPRDTFVDRVRATLAAQPDGLERERVEVARDHSFGALLRRLEEVPA